MAALLGRNGAGKSTLFLHFNGIHQPKSGEVYIDGEKLEYDKESLLKARQKIGIVFQNPDNQLFAPTVWWTKEESGYSRYFSYETRVNDS